MNRVTVDKAALDALLQSVSDAPGCDVSHIATELRLEDLIEEALDAASLKRGKRQTGDDDLRTNIVLGVSSVMNKHIRDEADKADTNIQVYCRAVLELAQRAGLTEKITAAFIARSNKN